MRRISSPKILIEICVLSSLFAFVFYFLIINNYIYLYYNEYLYQTYSDGSYENFQDIGKDDALYHAIEHYINREIIKGKKSIRLNISTNIFFFIQTVTYVDVYFGTDNCVNCIKRVVFRHLPG